MSYSLINSAALGFELAHLPAGPTVACALLVGLDADEATVRAIGSCAVAQLANSRDAANPTVKFARLRSAQTIMASAENAHAATAILPLFRLDDAGALDRFVRTEIMGNDHFLRGVPVAVLEQASIVLSNYVVSAWARVGKSSDSRPAPHEIFSRFGGPQTRDLGPFTAAVIDLLQSLEGPHARNDWLRVMPADDVAWASAMHAGAWAAHLSGRVRVAARAQLLGVLAFRRAGFGPEHVAGGVWRALSGTLQAIVLTDILDDVSRSVLLSPAYRVADPQQG